MINLSSRKFNDHAQTVRRGFHSNTQDKRLLFGGIWSGTIHHFLIRWHVLEKENITTIELTYILFKIMLPTYNLYAKANWNLNVTSMDENALNPLSPQIDQDWFSSDYIFKSGSKSYGITDQ